jgi:lycopene cyclase domain-containing protein
VWAAPPLVLQRAVAGDLLRPRLADRALLALPVGLWLCVADRLALADGIWTIEPASSTGVLVLGLPLEEGLFFLLTTWLVVDGLVLATDARALARARRLVAPLLARPGPAALVRAAIRTHRERTVVRS